MSLLRLLFLISVVYIIYRLFRSLTVKRDSGENTLETTSMVRCAYCDVYIVKKEAYIKNNNFYCNSDHYDRSLENESK